MSKATLIYSEKRAIRACSKEVIILCMDIFDIYPQMDSGLFLSRYRLSWIAFQNNEPEERVLIDAHSPYGLHYHNENEKRVSLNANSIEEALALFEKLIEEKFGELEEGIL